VAHQSNPSWTPARDAASYPTASTIGGKKNSVWALARRFAHAIPMCVVARLSGTDAHGRTFSERTIIEYGTAAVWLFTSALPLEPGDFVRLANDDGSFDVTGCVVAVQNDHEKAAVAVRSVTPAEAAAARVQKPMAARPALWKS